MPLRKSIIPDSNHVVRHCSASKIAEDGWPTGEAFVLRPQDKLENESGYGLSVNWLEYYGNDKESSLQKIRDDLNRTLTDSQRLAILNVRKTRLEVEEKCSNNLEFFRYSNRHPNEAESHSLVKGYEPDGIAVQDAIALSVLEIAPAKAK